MIIPETKVYNFSNKIVFCDFLKTEEINVIIFLLVGDD